MLRRRYFPQVRLALFVILPCGEALGVPVLTLGIKRCPLRSPSDPPPLPPSHAHTRTHPCPHEAPHPAPSPSPSLVALFAAREPGACRYTTDLNRGTAYGVFYASVRARPGAFKFP